MARKSEMIDMTLYDIFSEDMIKKYKVVNMKKPASRRGLPEIHATGSIWRGWVAKRRTVTSEIYLFLKNVVVKTYKGRSVIININRFVR